MEPEKTISRQNNAFPVTRWSLIAQVRQGGESRQAAIGEIYRRYWYPIYGYLRRTGRTAEDAEDLAQGFFLSLVARPTLEAAVPASGMLRGFLLGALKHYLADHYRHAHAAKRGGGRLLLPLERDDAEQRYAFEPPDGRDPETLFHQAWARELLSRVSWQLRASLQRAERSEALLLLEPYLAGDEVPPYPALAVRAGIKEATLRVMLSRLRRKYRELLEEEIAHTVHGAGEVQQELAWLRAVLAR